MHERAVGGYAPDDPDRIAALISLATAYYSVDQTTDAITLLEQAIDLQQQLDGEDAVDTLQWKGNLGVLYIATGRWPEALTLLEQVVAAEEKVHCRRSLPSGCASRPPQTLPAPASLGPADGGGHFGLEVAPGLSHPLTSAETWQRAD